MNLNYKVKTRPCIISYAMPFMGLTRLHCAVDADALQVRPPPQNKANFLQHEEMADYNYFTGSRAVDQGSILHNEKARIRPITLSHK